MAGCGALPGCARLDGGLAGIVDHHGALADHLHAAVRDDRGRALVDADAHEGGMIEDQADQAAVALALEEVLVDDGVGPEPKAGRGLRGAGGDALEVCIAGDHEARHDGGAGAGAAHNGAGRVAGADGLGQRCAVEGPGQVVLVATGEPDERRRVDGLPVGGQVAEVQPPAAGGARLAPHLARDLACVGQFRGLRQHDDGRRRSTGELQGALQYGIRDAAAADDHEVAFGCRRCLGRRCLGGGGHTREHQQQEHCEHGIPTSS